MCDSQVPIETILDVEVDPEAGKRSPSTEVGFISHEAKHTVSALRVGRRGPSKALPAPSSDLRSQAGGSVHSETAHVKHDARHAHEDCAAAHDSNEGGDGCCAAAAAEGDRPDATAQALTSDKNHVHKVFRHPPFPKYRFARLFLATIF